MRERWADLATVWAVDAFAVRFDLLNWLDAAHGVGHGGMTSCAGAAMGLPR